MKIQENVVLAPLTTLGIGGPARWFVEAASEAEIAEACAWVRERSVPLFVLGGGSNVLVSNRGFDGLVVRVAIQGMQVEGELLRAAAGVTWDGCVEQALGADCAGIECLAGIPGTVGGTPVQNVGAYGQEVASAIERVRAFDRAVREFVEFTNTECRFAYRRSRFNTVDRGRYVVTRVDYRLRRGGEPTLAYADLKAHFSGGKKPPSLAEVAAAVRGIRQSKGMFLVEGDPDCRSAGSFFKNPSVAPEVAERVQQIAAHSGIAVRVFPADSGLVKIPAAWLIEQAGFRKGYTLGAAGISSRHTLALINRGDGRGSARAEEILALAEKIQAAVEKMFGIRLEMEPERVGF
ncbi:MAG: UDP-N-acetylmuramate dehydrogenase [Terracidiphilus sp.]